jgi:hypothetical protein
MGTSGGAASDTWNYLNVPWAGVRTSTLRDAVVEIGGETNVLTPLAGWGEASQVIRKLNSFDGYTAFAQALPRSPKVVALPSGVALAKAGSCRESAGHTDSHGKSQHNRLLFPLISCNRPIDVAHVLGEYRSSYNRHCG